MKNILITAYAINPFKGSEDGMGWNFVLQAARYNRVIAVTRKNNRSHIEKYIEQNAPPHIENVSFLYFDLPYFLRFWKKGEVLSLVYFYLWQFFMPLFILLSRVKVDIVHNLNFHNDWTPTFLWMLGKPMVWGPVGHHPKIPNHFLSRFYGPSAVKADNFKWKFKSFFWNFDPFLKIAARRAKVVLAMNSTVGDQLKGVDHKTVLCSSVATEATTIQSTPTKNRFHIISAGRFVYLKGFDITIQSFAAYYHQLTEDRKNEVHLTIVGDGPDLNKMQALIAQQGISEKVTIVKWIERTKLMELYAQSDLFFFPSHEGAGMVVAEAMSYGLPVLCFDNSGPGEFIDNSCGIALPYGDYDVTIKAFAQSLHQLHHCFAMRQVMSANAKVRFMQNYEWNVKGELFREVYHQAIQPRIVAVHLLDDYSGSPRVLAQAVRAWQQNGNEVKLYTGSNLKGILSDLHIDNHKKFFYKFFENKVLRTICLNFSQIHLFFLLVFTLKSKDRLYVNTLLPFGAALAGRIRGVEVIYHIHETSINPMVLKKFLRTIVKLTATKVIYVSDYLSKSEPITGPRSMVIYNSLPNEFVEQASKFTIARSEKFNVMMLCSCKAYKGVNEFVELANKLPRFDFTLVLNASEMEVRHFFNGAQLPPNLCMYFEVRDTHSFYQKADVVLNLSHPDRWIETFGLTVLEASAYGKPVIVPEVGGPAEIISHAINGFTISVHKLDDICHQLQLLYRDKEMYLTIAAAAKTNATRFSAAQQSSALCKAVA
ncbi:MAG: a-glycosyltransferase-related protein glycosyltransferase family 4 protein [Bacteroidota bacterium]|jgi:glycosyltransferase involved in cell wall biosynthesis